MRLVNGNASPGNLHSGPLPPAKVGETPAAREDCKRALDDALLERLVALNTERVEEERRGVVHWLRPDFQMPKDTTVPTQVEMAVGVEAELLATATAEKVPWPKALPDQVRQVAEIVAKTRAPLSDDDIAGHFKGRGPWKRRLPQIVETLIALGRARRVSNGVLGAN